jgi:hypothetical protein
MLTQIGLVSNLEIWEEQFISLSGRIWNFLQRWKGCWPEFDSSIAYFIFILLKLKNLTFNFNSKKYHIKKNDSKIFKQNRKKFVCTKGQKERMEACWLEICRLRRGRTIFWILRFYLFLFLFWSRNNGLDGNQASVVVSTRSCLTFGIDTFQTKTVKCVLNSVNCLQLLSKIVTLC